MVHKTAKIRGNDKWNEVFKYQVKNTNSRVDFKVLATYVTYTGNTTISELIENAGKEATYYFEGGLLKI